MKKLAAFGTALVLFVISVIVLHFAVAGRVTAEDGGFGTWINTYKDMSYKAVAENIDEDTVMYLGSSEFQHGEGTPYHPTEIFRAMKMDVMCIGAAYNQCLSHAITMGALGPQLQSKKTVLILSPAWFNGPGVEKDAFGVRFSESMYMAMLENPNLSGDVKKKIAERAEDLLSNSPALQENVKRYDKIFIGSGGNTADRTYFNMKKAFLNEREAINVNTAWKTTEEKKYRKFMETAKTGTADWDGLKKQSDEEFKKLSEGNSFHMDNRLYKKNIEPSLKKEKNSSTARRFWKDSPEYGDLEIFLQVCREQDIDVELILLPVSGWWYDYTGFTADKRKPLPAQIKAVADKYDTPLYSFFDRDYTEGWLEDAVHPAGKGWVEINEEAYRFFTEG